jgi:hypothetical protein
VLRAALGKGIGLVADGVVVGIIGKGAGPEMIPL